MNTHTAEMVRKILRSNHKESVKLCDSQVILFWINNSNLRQISGAMGA